MSTNIEHTQAKQQWLAQRLKHFNTKKIPLGITPQPRPPTLPLSFAQQRLWFLEQWEPKGTTYLLPYAWRLRGCLDITALEASLAGLVARHESLRTAFSMVDGHLVQVIAPAAPVSLPFHDLTAFSVSTRDAEVQRFIYEDAHQSFDLTIGPLWRGQLLRLAPEDHVLLLTIHHIITDGWSMGIVFQELSTLYSAQVTGQLATLLPLPIQYADFAIWQRHWLQGDVLDRQLTYWRTQLAEVPPSLDFPTDAPRPLQQTYRGDRISFTLPPSLSLGLKRLSQQEGVTLFMTLLAAFQILLARYTGQRDILVGTPIAGRTHTELEGLIGFFVNTLVLRTQFKGQPTFREMLQQVQETCLNAYAHQDLPFEKLVQALQPVRDPSRHPIFQVMFQLHHASLADSLKFPHLQVESLSGTSQTAKFDLALSLISTGKNIQGSLTFNTDLFDLGTMTRLAKHYQLLMESVTADPGRDVFQLPLLTEAERHQLLVGWNPPISYQDISTSCVQHLFEAQAAHTPDAVAIVYADQLVTYQEINERANQLAQYLLAKGVGPEARVGICLERGLELIVSLLGILKAGGAYVPIDPATPTHRIANMLSDAQVLLVLTQTAQLQGLPQTHIPLVTWETLGPQLSQQIKANPVVSISFDQLAYLIYTSGSTGTPKGIAISHGALQNHMDWMKKAFTFSSEDRVLQKTSISFDASVWEYWMPLLTGGSVVMAESEDSRDLPRLIQRINMHQVTHLQMVPSSLSLLLQEPEIFQCHSLRHLFSGGEILSNSLQQRCYQTLPATLHNLYGPTETTIDITVWTCRPTIPSSHVPIGRPITNAHIFLVDKFQQLVPIGVTSELLIGGIPLSRGYWNQPVLTAERFQPNPYSDTPGARLYRTGDLGRLHSDGTLEYLGRLDHQVKLRGFRIELGEIESVLAQHPDVRNAVVLCREDAPGDKQLVAYVVSTSETPLEPATLRPYLTTRLPDYMLPATFVVLNALPLLPNGKVNRRALPLPDPTHRTRATASVPPRTPIEELLAEIWRDLLKVDYLGVHDNFFDLGGHSLLATQVVSRLRALMQTDVSVRTFFDCPTIAQLAKSLEALGYLNVADQALPLRPQNHEGPLPLSFAQQRLWFLEQWEPGSTAYLLPYAWRLKGTLKVDILEASLTALVTRHESLRTNCIVVDGQPVQIIAPVAPISLPCRDLATLSEPERETELERLIHHESHQPFDLTTEPLWRGQLLRLGPEEYVLLLTIHHIITDGWSMGIMFQELNAFYTTQATGHPMTLPPLPVQYADFTIWQRHWLQGDVLDRQLTYWRTQLSEAPPSLDLPTDFPRPLKQTYRGDCQAFTLPPLLTQALQTLSQQEGVTLFMTLLAAFQLCLFRYTGQRDFLVGTPIAGRTHTELEGLIGFFVNTLVLRTRITAKESFRDLVHQVRETCLEAYAHQDLPFEKLVEVLRPVRDPSRHPLFQVLFQLHQANATTELDLANLEVTPLFSSSHTAKFDLSLGLVLRGETLQGTVTFNTDLFDAPTIKRLTAHYHMLLEGLVADPTCPVSQLPLLTEAERQQLLVDWNPPFSQELPTLCIHHLFETQATSKPEAIAVVFEDQHLTYSELNARANQLANYLHRQGIEPEVRVGVCLERGVDLIISLLAILKAGGAYVPLDPSTPTNRLRFMLGDAGVAVVLTSSALQRQLAACLNPVETTGLARALVIVIDREWPSPLLTERSTSSLKTVHAANLAYVMYTSGSTGQPKGVSIPHRAVVRLIQHPTYVPWPAQVTCLQFASPSFDAATFEIWACLVQGGKLVLGPPFLPSLDELGALLQHHQITILWLTAGLFHQMVDWNIKALSPVQTLLAGGDVLSPAHVRRLVEQLPNCQLINGYGPTENTTFTCCFAIPLAEDLVNSVPLGRPLNHTQVYVLDAQQHLVPRGVPGELCIGGLGLGRGYHDRPSLTAEKFIPHSFSPVPGVRLYRSGDIVRYRPGGTLEFLGRRDHQVKIRGYRIECGEIEMILTTHPAVREVVVLPREDSMGNKRLVAYIVPESESTPTISEFRDFLIRTLPSYMIPAGFVFLDAFPLTSNGKIDRRKLPAEDQRSSQDEERYVAPRNSLEAQLTKIWETVLKKHPIGITDNFFNLGGESLLAIRLCSEMERALHKKIPLTLIFHAQTIEQLVKLIGQGEENDHLSLMVPIQPNGSNPPIFCFGIGSNFKRYLKDYPKQPLYTFLNPGHDGRPVLNTSVEKVATQCLKEMCTVQPEGPYYLAGYSFGGPVVYEMAQQLRKQGKPIGLLALIDPTTPLSKPAPPSREIRLNYFLSTTRLQIKEMLTNLNTISPSISTKIWKALQWRLKKKIHPFEGKLKNLLCKVYFGFRYPLPTFLRRFYRDIVVKQAARQYIPQNYPGQIVIFQSTNSLEPYWSKLCAEVVQVYDIPCKHGDVYLDRPHTPMLLHQLMKCLEKSQENTRLKRS